MPDRDDDISLRVRVLNRQGQPLGGTVDIDIQSRDTSDSLRVRGADASKDIDISGLPRFPQVPVYEVTVTPTKIFKPSSQFVTVPASGFITVTFVIDVGSEPPCGPLPAGTVGPELTIDPPSLQRLLVSAATQGGAGTVVWTQNRSELLVSTGQVTARLDDGLVVVSIPVSCDQASSAVVEVPFAVGGKNSPAGMIVATEDKPRGPEAIVRIWGEALTAFAWQTVLTVLTKLAVRAGVDQDGAGLIPAAITSGTDGLRLLTQARQSFDRVPR